MAEARRERRTVDLFHMRRRVSNRSREIVQAFISILEHTYWYMQGKAQKPFSTKSKKSVWSGLAHALFNLTRYLKSVNMEIDPIVVNSSATSPAAEIETQVTDQQTSTSGTH